MSAGLEGQITGFSLLQAAAMSLAGVSAQQTAKRDADLMRKVGKIEAENVRKVNRRLEGAQIAAHRGDMTGSILDIRADSAAIGELDALRTRFGFRSRAARRESEGRESLIARTIQAGGTILGAELEKARQNPKPVSRE